MGRTLSDGTPTLGGLAERLSEKLASGEVNGNEPCFLLRGQDVFAPELVRFWARQLEHYGGSPALRQEAAVIAAAMERWPGRKLPD